jgi:putative heme-binding domain-containing protein
MRNPCVSVITGLSWVAVATAQGLVPTPIESPTADDLAGGARVYTQYCARCHGMDGSGGMGPPLARPKLRRAADEPAILDILVNGIPGSAMQAAWMLSERETRQVTAYVRSLGRRPEEPLPGDPSRGAAIYARVGCAACHVLDGEGLAIGPELSDIGLRRGSAFLRESLRDPAAALPVRAVLYEPYEYPAYQVVRARRHDGTEIAGLRLNEDAFTVQLREIGGRLHSLRKSDLLELVPTGTTLMPSYRDQLTDAEMSDLVAYLMTRQGTR